MLIPLESATSVLEDNKNTVPSNNPIARSYSQIYLASRENPGGFIPEVLVDAIFKQNSISVNNNVFPYSVPEEIETLPFDTLEKSFRRVQQQVFQRIGKTSVAFKSDQLINSSNTAFSISSNQSTYYLRRDDFLRTGELGGKNNEISISRVRSVAGRIRMSLPDRFKGVSFNDLFNIALDAEVAHEKTHAFIDADVITSIIDLEGVSSEYDRSSYFNPENGSVMISPFYTCGLMLAVEEAKSDYHETFALLAGNSQDSEFVLFNELMARGVEKHVLIESVRSLGLTSSELDTFIREMFSSQEELARSIIQEIMILKSTYEDFNIHEFFCLRDKVKAGQLLRLPMLNHRDLMYLVEPFSIKQVQDYLNFS